MIRPCNICDSRTFTHRRTMSDEVLWLRRHEKSAYAPTTQVICELCINEMIAGKPTQEKIDRAVKIYQLANGQIGETVPFDPSI